MLIICLVILLVLTATCFYISNEKRKLEDKFDFLSKKTSFYIDLIFDKKKSRCEKIKEIKWHEEKSTFER